MDEASRENVLFIKMVFTERYGCVTMRKINLDALLGGNRTELFKFVKKFVPEGKLLDLGAGTGEFVAMFSDAKGVDLEFESDKVTKADIFIYLKKMTKPVTTITALDVLEHLTCDQVIHLFTLLKDHCDTFIATLPCPYTTSFFSHPYHITVWFPEVLGKIAEELGFKWRIVLIPTGSRFEGIRNWIIEKLWIGKFLNSYIFIAEKNK